MDKRLIVASAIGGSVAALIVLGIGGYFLVKKLTAGGSELQARLTAQGGALTTTTTNLCRQAAREAVMAKMAEMGITEQWIANVARAGSVFSAAGG